MIEDFDNLLNFGQELLKKHKMKMNLSLILKTI